MLHDGAGEPRGVVHQSDGIADGGSVQRLFVGGERRRQWHQQPGEHQHRRAFQGGQRHQLKADGTRDARFTAKVFTITTKRPSNATHGVGTTFDYSMYSVRESPVPIIRNEELILLRAEARYFTGDLVGALADINTIRATAGGLAPLVGFASESAFIDELLYNRRLSLVFEGHRWVDMRRFGRLNQLTLDLPTHVVISELPVPQQECLSRARADAALKGPGC